MIKLPIDIRDIVLSDIPLTKYLVVEQVGVFFFDGGLNIIATYPNTHFAFLYANIRQLFYPYRTIHVMQGKDLVKAYLNIERKRENGGN